jgi:2-polyprenyl-3-methyl-5-hydroxy-6-metoxy-1,4-benzoquinol methylase
MNNNEKFWDKAAENYDQTENSLKPLHTWAVEKTIKYLDADNTVLEIGCGTGEKTLELAQYAESILATDISSVMIQSAQKKKDDHDIKNVDFIKTAIFDNSLKKETYDIILTFNVLHFIINREQFMKRINYLLKPGGIFICTVPCLGEKLKFTVRLQIMIAQLASFTGIIPIGFRRLKFRDLEDIIRAGGFIIIEKENMHYKLSSCFIAARKE